MPLYQLVCLTRHYKEYRPIKELVSTTVKSVLSNGGCVRKIDYYGHRHLPDYIGRGVSRTNETDQWTMHFDANPPSMRKLSDDLRNDPRILRHTMLKLGSTFSKVTQNPSGERDPTISFPHFTTTPSSSQSNNSSDKSSSSALSDLI